MNCLAVSSTLDLLTASVEFRAWLHVQFLHAKIAHLTIVFFTREEEGVGVATDYDVDVRHIGSDALI